MESMAFIVILLATVVLSSIIARSFTITLPLPLIQIALGCVIANVSSFRVSLEPDVFFLLFLAPLLFLDGWRIPREGLFRDKWTIISLAFGLVLFTVLGAGVFIHWLIPAISLPAAFALASILSPTDTIAVSSAASRAPIPRRLMVILEGESLLNDASGLVCFRFAVAVAMTGNLVLWKAAGTFIWLALGGLLVGVATCVVANTTKDWVSRKFGEEVGAQILVSLIIPFTAYLIADTVGASGILAAVAAGIMMGIEERSGRASAVTRIRRSAVWDAVQFAGNGVIFVLLGHQLPGIIAGAGSAIQQTDKHNELWLIFYVLAICVVLTAIRSAWAWVTIRLRLALGEKWGHGTAASDSRLVAITAFAGARGAVTLAAAMTIPLSLRDGTAWPARDLTILLAAGVIVVSLISASAGLAFVTRPFKVSRVNELQEECAIRSIAARAAIDAIGEAVREKEAQGSGADLYVQAGKRIAADYHRRIEANSVTGRESPLAAQADEIERSLRLIALDAERREMYSAARLGRQNQELIRDLVYEIDLQESQLFSRRPTAS